MAKTKLGSASRFGPRYGHSLKAKVLVIESGYRQKQQCPYCLRKAVKRVAPGIWYCKKCDSKFTSKAYKLGE